MHIAVTKVKLKPGTAADCARLFEETNPALVRDQPDWLGAQMAFDAETNTVTVIAQWKDIESYQRLSGSSTFQQAMGKFAAFFAGPPEITSMEVLVDMKPEDLV